MGSPQPMVLESCTLQPLMSYLKALGVVRIVAEQRDPSLRAAWQLDTLCLQTHLDPEDLVAFFLDDFRPSPILAPWNADSGFWDDRSGGQALRRLEETTNPRLAAYSSTVRAVRALLATTGLKARPDREAKRRLLRLCRAELPDEMVEWLDTSLVLTAEDAVYPPLLGGGGADGRLEFSANCIQRLEEVIDFRPGVDPQVDRSLATARLRLSLFNEGAAPLTKAAVGQFHPGGVGGPNATRGWDAASLVNPWDYLLMLEGAVLLAGSVARRMGANPERMASFPFSARVSAAGWGTVSSSDASGARAELWLPVWHRPTSLPEIRQVFAEGRAQVGRRQARTGVDFARAAASLGVDRGIASFTRYGFVKRSGQSHLAAPLGQLQVRLVADVGLVDELDPWLDRLRAACYRSETPESYRRALRDIEESIFAYCRYGGKAHLAAVAAALGRATKTLGRKSRTRDSLRPLHHLSPRWLNACDDGSQEFRLAAALASVGDSTVGPIRRQLEQVVLKGNQAHWDPEDRPVARHGSLADQLTWILQRRLLEGLRVNLETCPVDGPLKASLADISAFICGLTDDHRLEALFRGLATLRWHEARPAPRAQWAPGTDPGLPRAYCLLKLAHLPHPLTRRGREPVSVKPDTAALSRLRAGDLATALGIVRRRLVASGLVPLGPGPGAAGFAYNPATTTRLAAALLFPMWQTDALVRMVLRDTPSPEDTPVQGGKNDGN